MLIRLQATSPFLSFFPVFFLQKINTIRPANFFFSIGVRVNSTQNVPLSKKWSVEICSKHFQIWAMEPLQILIKIERNLFLIFERKENFNTSKPGKNTLRYVGRTYIFHIFLTVQNGIEVFVRENLRQVDFFTRLYPIISIQSSTKNQISQTFFSM